MHRMVKRSSPHVNIMIIAGAVIFYTTVILFGVDENTASFQVVDDLCHARVWLCVIGFSLLFGTIFAKAWRIYYIFSNSKINKLVVRKMAMHMQKMEITDIFNTYLLLMYFCRKSQIFTYSELLQSLYCLILYLCFHRLLLVVLY